MAKLKPIYTPKNCKGAFQLNWSLSIFWKEEAIAAGGWGDAVSAATEVDGVRILEQRLVGSNTSQFLLITRPPVSAAATIRSVKGRLQHIVRSRRPRAFRRNYSMHSVGSANKEAVERYVASQHEHHPMADERVQQRLRTHGGVDGRVDLSRVRRSAHGEFIYNLHLVLVHQGRDVDVREKSLATTSRTISQIAAKKGHLLSRGSVLADHVHLTMGCDLIESPEDIALGYMNNLAYAHGMKPVYQFGFFVGTFGPYDLNAVRRAIRGGEVEPMSRHSAGAGPAERLRGTRRILAASRAPAGAGPAESRRP